MDVTVVIPCFNEDPAHLNQAVESARQLAGVEIIVVDDGSTNPGTIAALDSLGVQVICQQNAGVSAARNVGIAAGTGRYILPLDSDDYLSEDFFRPLIHHLDVTDSVAASVTYHSFGHKNETITPPSMVDGPSMAVQCQISNTSMFRRADWERCGGYDETLRVGFEDWEWWVRLLLQTGGVARRVDGPHFMYRVSAEGRNHSNHAGIRALALTRQAMVKNNPDYPDPLLKGLISDLTVAYVQGQNQSPLAEEATRQARYWARRYGKVEGLRSRIEAVARRLR